MEVNLFVCSGNMDNIIVKTLNFNFLIISDTKILQPLCLSDFCIELYCL